MTKNKKREVFLISGKAGTGKSKLTSWLLYHFNRVVIFDPLQEHEGVDCQTLEEVAAKILGPLFRIRFSDQSQFENLCRLVYERGDLWFCVEEANRVLPAGPGLFTPAVGDLVFRSRHQNVNLVLVTQRLSTVAINARSQWTRLVSFRQTEPADLGYIDSQSPDGPLAEEIKALPDYQYLYITPWGVTRGGPTLQNRNPPPLTPFRY